MPIESGSYLASNLSFRPRRASEQLSSSRLAISSLLSRGRAAIPSTVLDQATSGEGYNECARACKKQLPLTQTSRIEVPIQNGSRRATALLNGPLPFCFCCLGLPPWCKPLSF